MAASESGPSRANSNAELGATTYVPEGWRDKYKDIRVAVDQEDPTHEVLLGVYEEEGEERTERVGLVSVLEVIREAENRRADAEQQTEHLNARVQTLEHRIAEQDAEIARLREELERTARQFEELRARFDTPAEPRTTLRVTDEERAEQRSSLGRFPLAAEAAYRDEPDAWKELIEAGDPLVVRVNGVEETGWLATSDFTREGGQEYVYAKKLGDDTPYRIDREDIIQAGEVAAAAMATNNPEALDELPAVPATRVMTGRDEVVAEPVEPAPATPPVAELEEDEDLSGQDRKRSRWSRARERVGGAILGWQVQAHNGAYRIMNRRGEVVDEVDDETAYEYRESERRAGGAAILGGLALLGAGVLVGWFLHRHGHGNEYNEIITNGKIPRDQLNQLTDKLNDIQSNVGGLQADRMREMNKLSDIAGQIAADRKLDTSNHNLLQHISRHLHNARTVSVGDLDVRSFNTTSFYGQTPHQAVSNMFDVIRDNNIKVHGLTQRKIDAITRSMMREHWQVAAGVKAGGQQNLGDVAQTWSDGRTDNWRASGLQGLRRVNGSTADSWERFMRLASRHGVDFSRA
jgi:uncharacterized coiled-coil protein SlyX